MEHPSYNHTREDSALYPCPECKAEQQRLIGSEIQRLWTDGLSKKEAKR